MVQVHGLRNLGLPSSVFQHPSTVRGVLSRHQGSQPAQPALCWDLREREFIHCSVHARPGDRRVNKREALLVLLSWVPSTLGERQHQTDRHTKESPFVCESTRLCILCEMSWERETGVVSQRASKALPRSLGIILRGQQAGLLRDMGRSGT